MMMINSYFPILPEVKRKILILICTVTVMAFGDKSIAQENDYGTWLTIDLTKELTKRLDLELEEEVRIFQQFSEISRFATTAGVSYSMAEFLKVAAGYTWIYRHDVKDSFWENRHRYFLQLTGKATIGRLDFSLREKFQSTYIDKDVKGFDFSPENYLRSRLQIAWDVKNSPLKPYGSAEMHYQLNNPDGNKVNNWRYTAGIEFPLSKMLNLDTYLRLSHELNVKNPVDLYLIGVNLKWKL